MEARPPVMKTLLLFPPSADPAHPPLGIAAVAGFLSEHGKEVALLDLNVRAFKELLSAAWLTRCAERLRGQIERWDGLQRLTIEDLGAYHAAAQNLPSAAYLIEQIDAARQRLRDPKVYLNRRTYAGVTSIIRRAMEFISAAHYPAHWSAGGFSMSYQSTKSADVMAAIDDQHQNLFIPFFETVLPEIAGRRPDVVGISLNYYGQMIPAMTLAAMIKRALSRAFVVVGGGLISFFERRWEVLACFRGFVDGWIPFEGERPLLDLIKTLEKGGSLNESPGLLRFQGETPIYRPPGPLLETRELPPPSFDGLALDGYLAPEIILPVLASRGCYWARCAFCSHRQLYRNRFRNTSAAAVVETIGYLSRKYGAKCFYFVDEAIPPRIATEFASAVAAAGLPYRWFTEARFERYFDPIRLNKLYQGGCRMLIFGLESAVTRVLNLMDKGITTEVAAEILGNCAAAGIRTFVMFFVGFPSETRAEADLTLKFVEEHRQQITHIASGQFVLEPQSPMFCNLERFGITDVYPYSDHDLKTWYQYRVREGMRSSEAAALARAIEQRDSELSAGFYLLSRSHLVFLPPEQDRGEDAAPKTPVDLSRPEKLIPRRRTGLVPLVLSFNLNKVQEHLHESAGTGKIVEASPTEYVCSPDREALIEVGSGGIALLRACNGEFTLEDILAIVDEPSRGTTLRFMKDLEARDFIEWETLP